jgi:DNA transformation protein
MSEKLRNIGPKSMAWLRQTGVRTLDDLKAVGSLAAYVRVKRAGFKPSLNLLYALEGAILDCHWQEIPDERRSVLILQADEAVALLPKPKGKRMPVAGPVTTTRNDEDEHAVLPDPDGFGGFDEPSVTHDEAG